MGKLLNLNNILKKIENWNEVYISDDNSHSKNSIMALSNELVKISSVANTSILKYDDELKWCIHSDDAENDIDNAECLFLDFYLHKDKKYFDLIIKCFPKDCTFKFKSIIPAKRKKFLTGNAISADYAFFIIYFNFMNINSETNNKFPTACIREAHSKLKSPTVENFTFDFIKSIKKDVK